MNIQAISNAIQARPQYNTHLGKTNVKNISISNSVTKLTCSPDRMLQVSFKGLDYEDPNVRSAIYTFESLMGTAIGSSTEFSSIENAIQTLNLARGDNDPKSQSYNIFFRDAQNPDRTETYEWLPNRQRSGGRMRICAMQYNEEPILKESHISPEKAEAFKGAWIKLPINKYNFVKNYDTIKQVTYQKTNWHKYGTPAKTTYKAIDDRELSVRIVGADTEEDTANIMGLKKYDSAYSNNEWEERTANSHKVYEWNPETKSMVRII